MTTPALHQQQQTQPEGVSLTGPVIAAGLIATYVQATGELRQRMSDMVGALFGRGGYDDAAAAAYVEAMAPVAAAAQQTMAELTAGHLSHQVALLSGGPTLPVPVPEVTEGALRGVDQAELLRRPYQQVWTALSDGTPLEQAAQIGLRRAESIAATDLQLAKTHTAQAVLAADHRVVGYRRVLTGPRSCGMCVIASSVRYHRADLMPIHPACDCAVAPIVGTHDPGRTINSATLSEDAQQVGVTEGGSPLYRHDGVLDLGDLLEAAHQAVEDRFGRRATDARSIDYRKVILVRQHSELGPVLTVADHKFTRQQIETGKLRAKPGSFGTARKRWSSDG